MKPLKIGMISLSHGHAYSYMHEMSSLTETVLVGIADEEPVRGKEAADKYGVPYYSDYGDLLASEADAVVICSTNARHAELVKASAAAGKHVLCEKPLGIDREEMREMIEACRAGGVKLMTAFPCRYLSGVVQAKEAIDRGEIGDILAMKGTNRGKMPGGWFTDRERSGGGAVLDHTVHVADLMSWFLGNAEATEVYAQVGTLFHEVDIDDAGMLHFRFDNGVFGVLDPSWSRPAAFPTWGDVTLEIIGTKGVISIDAFSQKNEVYGGQSGTHWDYWGDNMDRLMIRDFARSIIRGIPVPVTGEDGERAARIALMAYESAALGRPVRSV